MTPIYRDTQLTFQHRVRIIVIGPNTEDDRWQIYQKYFTKIVRVGRSSVKTRFRYYQNIN